MERPTHQDSVETASPRLGIEVLKVLSLQLHSPANLSQFQLTSGLSQTAATDVDAHNAARWPNAFCSLDCIETATGAQNQDIVPNLNIGQTYEEPEVLNMHHVNVHVRRGQLGVHYFLPCRSPRVPLRVKLSLP
jgi:hypothetical protein